MPAGVLAIVYFSRAFEPPGVPADPAAAADKSYYNTKAGIWAAIAFYLGGWCTYPRYPRPPLKPCTCRSPTCIRSCSLSRYFWRVLGFPPPQRRGLSGLSGMGTARDQ